MELYGFMNFAMDWWKLPTKLESLDALRVSMLVLSYGIGMAIADSYFKHGL